MPKMIDLMINDFFTVTLSFFDFTIFTIFLIHKIKNIAGIPKIIHIEIIDSILFPPQIYYIVIILIFTIFDFSAIHYTNFLFFLQ